MKNKLIIPLIVLILIIVCAGCTTKIVMPYSSEDYINGEWAIEELVSHFEELGFTNVEISGDAEKISGIYIENDESLFESFKKGDEYSSSRKIEIYTGPDLKASTPVEVPEIEYITFGTYEQDGDVINGAEKIEWIPLTEINGEILLVSRYILDYKDFNDTTQAVATSWENSTLRNWLNEEFYNKAFSNEEKRKIISTKVQDFKNDNANGNTTIDNVFVLNMKQVCEYFDSEDDRATVSTDYAKTQKSYITDSYWLINSSSNELYKYLINSEGKNENNPRVNESEGVRPAIWIKQ